MKLWPCGFKIEYTHLSFASAGAVWLGIWSSDHVVLKLIVRTSASPRQQQSHWGLTMTQDAYFSFLTHTKQLLLMIFCDSTAEMKVVLGHTNGRWTDRHVSWNSFFNAHCKNLTFENFIWPVHFIFHMLVWEGEKKVKNWLYSRIDFNWLLTSKNETRKLTCVGRSMFQNIICISKKNF